MKVRSFTRFAGGMQDQSRMATRTWAGFSSRIAHVTHSATRSQHAGLHRVAARLATQTVALLMVMLIVLEVILYLIIQQRLIGSLEDTLKGRAQLPASLVCQISHLPCPGNGGPGATGRQGQNPGGGGFGNFGGPGGGQNPGGAGNPGGGINPDLTPSDASSVFINPGIANCPPAMEHWAASSWTESGTHGAGDSARTVLLGPEVQRSDLSGVYDSASSQRAGSGRTSDEHL